METAGACRGLSESTAVTEETPYPPVALRHHATLTPPEPNDILTNVSVGPAGEAVALWCTPEAKAALEERRTAPNGVRYSPTVLDRSVPVRVTTYTPEATHTVAIWDLTLPSPHVQPLPGGRILLVGSRCQWYDEGADHNAAIYDSDGNLVAEGVLGDGIGRLATTPEGRIWVGYFDEGIFGNFGWGVSMGGATPIGAPGLVCFDDSFTPVWSFAEAAADVGSISDCYCLNVTGETAWVSYYTDFPVVRADTTGATGWRTDGDAAYVLLADEATRRVALFSGYGASNRDRLRVGTLDDATGEVSWQQSRWLVLPDGSKLPSSFIHGRGGTLHVLAGTEWYQLDLADLD